MELCNWIDEWKYLSSNEPQRIPHIHEIMDFHQFSLSLTLWVCAFHLIIFYIEIIGDLLPFLFPVILACIPHKYQYASHSVVEKHRHYYYSMWGNLLSFIIWLKTVSIQSLLFAYRHRNTHLMRFISVDKFRWMNAINFWHRPILLFKQDRAEWNVCRAIE